MSRKLLLPILLFLFNLDFAFGQIRLPRLISDGAVLQRDQPIRLWGWASPGERIVVSFNNQEFSITANYEGNWTTTLPAMPAGGPWTMIFRGSNTIELKNILFGDVWVCSGQSNMELPMRRIQEEYSDEIKTAGFSEIRQFLVPDRFNFQEPQRDFEDGYWIAANPESVLDFTAVGFFFAKALHDKYKVPIGLINASLGGAPIEAWMSEEVLAKFPDAFAELKKFKNDALIDSIQNADLLRKRDWYAKVNALDRGTINGNNWRLPNLYEADWEEMEVPGYWADQGKDDFNGVVWMRRNFKLENDPIDGEAKMVLGRIVDQDSVFVNGVFVGTTSYQYPPRKYSFPTTLLKEGYNTIAIRLISHRGRGGFVLDKPYFLKIGSDTFDLRGKWKFRIGAKTPPLDNPTFIRWKPGGLYNGMIAPMLNYQIKGVIWYQGESNAGNPKPYFETFPAMIADWRSKWHVGDFPFLFVQLASFMEETPEPTESSWAMLRQAQLHTLQVPNTGMAVITDIGEWNDVHPVNKKDVGLRLANEAFKLAYREKLYSGTPIPTKTKFRKKKVVIFFNNAPNGLITKSGGSPQYFEISNDGQHFKMAMAIIRKNKAVVSAPEINSPIAVRYAWADNPAKANLFSKEGFPVSPFEVRKFK